ncbi:xylose isomerase, partial [Enterococcus faecium]
MSYFPMIKEVKYEGPRTENPFAYRHYDPGQEILGKPMKEHLRFA